MNLVAACRPCNVIKGEGKFKNFDDAKAFVLRRRSELRQEWQKKAGRTHTSTSA
jgi:hypothetical protein